ncbi:hypothetical protein [Bacillus sp. JJ722]
MDNMVKYVYGRLEECNMLMIVGSLIITSVIGIIIATEISVVDA